MSSQQRADDSVYEVLRDCLRRDEPVALATVVATTEPTGLGAKLLVRLAGSIGTLGDPGLDSVAGRDALGALVSGQSSLRHYGPQGEIRQDTVTVFVEAFSPPPRMIILGAVDFSAALASMARVLGYRVVVCDARPVFATRERFPTAEEVVVEWPDRYLARVAPELGPRDAVCVLTHDTKFDVPAIVAALATDAGYIGAMGSRRTKERRDARLREVGVSDKDLARVRAPIGLDLGARTPEETAVSICAEIIACQTGTDTVVSLSQGTGAIHHDEHAS
ncbi:MAG TPA: XdhC/CoxI family protein [Acidimicrobiales bacterium]|nr:XdhC/CoxI family protein [Acidimicrobiales bacterium]